MASANFKKMTSGAVSALKVHLDNDERATHNHSNGDIDKAKTNENYFVGSGSWDEIKSSWEKRNAELDKLHPPKRIRSDRVTGVMVEFPCPWEIVNAGREKEYFGLVHDVLSKRFGSENVHGICVHRDEVHEYMDHGVKRLSMIHGHSLVTPEATWTAKDGSIQHGINGKHFMTREMLTSFNKELNEAVLERFGIELNTHGLARGKTVEELKRETKALEHEAKIEKALERVNAVKQEYNTATEELRVINEDIADLTQRRSEALEEFNQLNADLQPLLQKREELKKVNAQVDKNKDLIKKAQAIEHASKTLQIPQIRPQPIGSGTIVDAPPEIVKKAFRALQIETNLSDRVHIAEKREKSANIEIKRERDTLVDQIKELKQEKTSLMYASERTQLKELREDHPELFNVNGVYQRGHAVKDIDVDVAEVAKKAKHFMR